MRHDNIQILYEFEPATYAELRPDKRTLQVMYDHWLRTGHAPDGVTITATIWGSNATQDEIREYLMRQDITEQCPGIVSHYGEPTLTLVDYDEDPPSWDGTHVRELADSLGLTAEWVEYSRTRRGYHMVVKWTREFSPAEIVCLQLLLGSDPARERYNLLRALSGQADANPRWNLLFQRKL